MTGSVESVNDSNDVRVLHALQDLHLAQDLIFGFLYSPKFPLLYNLYRNFLSGFAMQRLFHHAEVATATSSKICGKRHEIYIERITYVPSIFST